MVFLVKLEFHYCPPKIQFMHISGCDDKSLNDYLKYLDLTVYLLKLNNHPHQDIVEGKKEEIKKVYLIFIYGVGSVRNTSNVSQIVGSALMLFDIMKGKFNGKTYSFENSIVELKGLNGRYLLERFI